MPSRKSITLVFAAILLLAATLVSFWPVRHNGFLWDDRANILSNADFRGLSYENLEWMATAFHMGHYHPLTWLSLAIDYELWGLEAKGFLLTNLFLHSLTAICFFFVARAVLRLARGCRFERETARLHETEPRESWLTLAAFGAALLFAIHPQRVESVSWVTERRDVLSGFFWMLTVLLWLSYGKAAGSGRSWLWYGGALMAFALSLSAKAWGITLPVVLLILDIYPLGRLIRQGRFADWAPRSRQLAAYPLRRLVFEKVPFFALAVVFATTAYLAQKAVAMDMVKDHTLFDRVIQSGYGLLFYPWKFFWPAELLPLYLLRHDFNPLAWPFLYAAIGSVLITMGILSQWRRWPWLVVVWVIYGIIISPVLGLTQSGQQIAADRYSYLACLGFAILAGGLFLKVQFRRFGPIAVALSLSVIGLLLGTATWRYTKEWKSEQTLWAYTLKHDPTNYVALNNYGLTLEEGDDSEGAYAYYEKAVALDPTYAGAYYNRGNMRSMKGDIAGALEDYDAALREDPKLVKALNNRGNIYRDLGRFDESLADHSEALRINPRYADAYYNRGLTHRAMNNNLMAIEDYTRAIETNPRFMLAYNNRANCYRLEGKDDLALADYAKCIEIDSNYFNAWFNRANLYRDRKEWAQSAADYTRALEINPEYQPAHVNLAICQWRLGNFANAEKHFIKANSINPKDPITLFNYAAMLRELGKPQEAMRIYQLTLQVAPQNWPHRGQVVEIIRALSQDEK